MGVEMLIQGQKVWKEQKSENSALHCPLRKKKETAKASRLLAGRVKKKSEENHLNVKLALSDVSSGVEETHLIALETQQGGLQYECSQWHHHVLLFWMLSCTMLLLLIPISKTQLP